MKKYIDYSVAFLVLTLICGCSLEEENPSAISTAQEWSTAEGYEKLVNGCYYDLIRVIYGQAEDTYLIMAEGGTDIWQDPNDGSNGNWSKVLCYSDYGPSSDCYTEGYEGFYGSLSQCNAAIHYADIVQGLSEERKNILLAEARFIRAHCLYNIVEYWGGKYLPTGLVGDVKGSTLTCSTVNEFYKVILEDLEFAMNNLPVSQSVRGHVTKAGAYHLYARACLTYATYTDGLGNCEKLSDSESKEYIQKGKQAAEYLINHQSELGVRLYDEAEEVFDEDNNKNNVETLFIVCHSNIASYNPRGSFYNRVFRKYAAYNSSTTGIFLDGINPSYETTVNKISVPKLIKGNCIMMPSKYMLDLYEPKDTRYKAFFYDTYYINTPNQGNYYRWTSSDAARYGLSSSRVGNQAYDIMIGDTAVYISRDHYYTQEEKENIRYAIYNVEDNYADQAHPKKFFPTLKKGDAPKLYQGTNAGNPYTSGDCFIYRLGETYLLAAEACWRLGDNTAAANYLNVIRNRACEGHDHSLDVQASEVTQDLLLDEYAREMIGEWSRWEILKRFRAFESRISKANPQISKFNDYYYLRPIPSAAILLIENGSEYQNPGF